MINPRRFKTATGTLAHPETTAGRWVDVGGSTRALLTLSGATEKPGTITLTTPTQVVVVKSKPGESPAELSRRIYARLFPWLREDGDDEDV